MTRHGTVRTPPQPTEAIALLDTAATELTRSHHPPVLAATNARRRRADRQRRNRVIDMPRTGTPENRTAEADVSSSRKPSVLFVCVHNAGRSQMAAAWLAHLAGDRVEVRSAGSAPADQVNPSVVKAMREVGVDVSAQTPKILTHDAVRESDVCVTMGCGDACPVFPGKRYLDWKLTDPAGQSVEAIRPIRDEIKPLVEDLIAEILPAQATTEGTTA